MRSEKSNGSSIIHRIQEMELDEVELESEYDIEKTLGEGCFAKVVLAVHRRCNTKVVLKAVHSEMTSLNSFFREFHYSYHLSPHPNVLSSYPVAFKADDCYVFAQEYAPYGDLAAVIREGGLPEDACKRVAQQLASALEFLHSKELVHRDIKLENILVFAPDLSKIKLCDFGETRREGCLVSKVKCTWHPFLPPEVCEAVSKEKFICRTAADCWQVAIVLFVCLTGSPPWKSADLADGDFSNFLKWQKRRTTKLPHNFRKFTPRALRMFRRLLEQKPEKRAPVTEVYKYLKDSWLTDTSPLQRKNSDNLYLNCKDDDDDDVKHVSDVSKTRLRKFLNSYGLETTVDQKAVAKRVWEWVLSCDNNVDTALDIT